MAVKTKDYIINLSDFTTEGTLIDVKNKNAIRIDGLTLEQAHTATYKIDNERLVVTYNNKSIKASNYKGIVYIKTDYEKVGKKETYNLFDLISESQIDNSLNPITTYNKNLTVTGTNYNDLINLSESGYTPKSKNKGLTINAGKGSDTITSTEYDDNIKGGNGNDLINGTLGIDTISGGIGSNTIKYTSLDQLDGDKITLTKGENFLVDISAIDNAAAEYKINGKNLDITVTNGTETKTFTLLNFGTKDVTNNATKKTKDTSSVELKLSNSELVDLRTTLVDSDKATWHADNIDKSDYKRYKDKKKTIVDTDVSKKGLTITGGAGNDVLTGTDYKDTIKANTGNIEKITGGTGNDKLYASTTTGSTTTFIFNPNDGNDTVFSGKGEDCLVFKNVSLADIQFEQGLKKNNKDLIVKYTFSDSVTIKNYYTVDKKGNITGVNPSNSFKYIKTSEGMFEFDKIQDTKEYGYIGDDNDNIIIGSSGKDSIDGKGGNDSLFGKSGNDTINGGTGNDSIYSGKGNDILDGGTGENSFYFSANDGINTILSNGGVDTVVFPDANSIDDISFNYSDSDLEFIYGATRVSLKDYKTGTHSVKYIQAGDKKYEFISKTDSGINITGTPNNDLIYGTDSIDNITGLAGDDRIYSGLGNDTITGGTGNDVLAGVGGNNTFVFSSGDGADTVYSGLGEDTLKFNDILPDSINFIKSGKNLTLKYTENDSVTIKDYYDNDDNPISSIRCIELQDKARYIADGCVGTDNDDYIIGSDHDEIIIAKAGDDYVIPQGGNDEINLGSGNDVLFAGSGNKVITAVSGNNTINLGSGSNTVFIGVNNDTVNSGSGENSIYFAENTGSNEIVSGTGNDSVIFSERDDFTGISASFSENNLNVIYGESNVLLKDFKSGHSVKTLKAGDTVQDLSILGGVTSGNIIFAGNNQATVNGTNADDIIYGGYNTTTNQQINTGSGNNIVYVNNGTSAKNINLNTGDDTIYTSSADILNTIAIQSNGGNDILHWLGSNSVKLLMANLYLEDINFVRNPESDDLIILYGTNNSCTVKDYYKTGNEELRDTLCIKLNDKYFDNYTVAQAITEKGGTTNCISGSNELNGTDGNDYIIGTSDADTIMANGGNDTIKPYDGDDVINLGSGNDILFAGNGNKTITAVSGLNTINLGSGNNTIYSGTDSDTINSGSGNNVIEFGTNDFSNDRYSYGGGNDTIVLKGDDLDNLRVDISGENVKLIQGSSKIILITNYMDPDHLLTVEDKVGDTITINNLDTKIGSATLTTNQTLTTGRGDDSIYAGLADDRINAGLGTNIINLASNDTGNNDIYIYGGGTDIIKLSGIENFNNCRLQKSGNDLVVAYSGDFDNNTLTIQDYYDNTDMNESISFAIGSGIPITLNDLITLTGGIEIPIYGTEDDDTLNYSTSETSIRIEGLEGNDVIIGSATVAGRLFGQDGDDSLTGGAGNDYLNGGSGSDSMLGGAGDDIYDISFGEYGNGQDTINDSSGDNDTLKIATTSEYVNLFFDVNLTKDGGGDVIVNEGLASFTTGNDIYMIRDSYDIEDAKTSDGIKITDYFNTGRIENILVQDENTWISTFDDSVLTKFGQIVANWLMEKGYDSTQEVIQKVIDEDINVEDKETFYNLYHPIISSAQTINTQADPDNDKVVIGMGNNNQNIYTYDGNDIVYSVDVDENKKNYVSTGSGNDTIYGSSGQLDVLAGAGDDVIYANEGGTKCVYLGTGNDTIYTSGDNSINRIYITEDGYTNGGQDVLNWLGASDVTLYLPNYSLSAVSLIKDNNDLKLLYGFDNYLTLKDYYAGGMSDFMFITKYKDDDHTLGEIVALKESDILTYKSGTTGPIEGDTDNEYIDAGENVTTVQANGGSDTVIINGNTEVFTNINSIASGKDATEGVVDTVVAKGDSAHTIHAQSETNIIISQGESVDNYKAYIDQKTSITDNGGVDSLTLVNTYDTTDGNKANLHILFNVGRNYEYDEYDSSTMFKGDVLVTNADNKANYDLWRANEDYSGITVKNNSIESVISSDATAYILTNTNISILAEEIATWLDSKGYMNVDLVFSNNNNPYGDNTADVEELIALFNTANWTQL